MPNFVWTFRDRWWGVSWRGWKTASLVRPVSSLRDPSAETCRFGRCCLGYKVFGVAVLTWWPEQRDLQLNAVNHYRQQYKPLIVITLDQRETDNINSLITLSVLSFPRSEVRFRKWDNQNSKTDIIMGLIRLSVIPLSSAYCSSFSFVFLIAKSVTLNIFQ